MLASNGLEPRMALDLHYRSAVIMGRCASVCIVLPDALMADYS